MTAQDYFNYKKLITNYCNKRNCQDDGFHDCPLSILNNPMHVNCVVLEQEYTNIAEKILQEEMELRFNKEVDL